jgi:hypothetical protein
MPSASGATRKRANASTSADSPVTGQLIIEVRRPNTGYDVVELPTDLDGAPSMSNSS